MTDLKDKKEPSDYWYYFGKCTPYPIQIRKGMTPSPPYKVFNTKEECQDYINKLNKLNK